jgi:hypothetical protein
VSRLVDLQPDGAAIGRCVVLPGRLYTADAPLLFFATQVALAHGWAVRQVWWQPAQRGEGADEIAWVGDQLDLAVDGYDGRILVIGKSLGTLAARRARECGYDAAWLTPLLTDPEAVEPLLSYPASQLVAIGSEDPYLDEGVLDRLPGTRVLVPGDHILGVPGDVPASVASHHEVIAALDAWLAGLGSTG